MPLNAGHSRTMMAGERAEVVENVTALMLACEANDRARLKEVMASGKVGSGTGHKCCAQFAAAAPCSLATTDAARKPGTRSKD